MALMRKDESFSQDSCGTITFRIIFICHTLELPRFYRYQLIIIHIAFDTLSEKRVYLNMTACIIPVHAE
ncbi:hypothetical protein Bhyg_04206 [Pseudolycoriella hygida]|uniref:Uncharacterized protein n=1 Tax=Pseudolycoriella hygida TaxID=35572 RepID=A0A9Q0NES1_9DIPT|nr:hypothetical protein Bhyg_04206 [Pseudolycoriella hygida]